MEPFAEYHLDLNHKFMNGGKVRPRTGGGGERQGFLPGCTSLPSAIKQFLFLLPHGGCTQGPVVSDRGWRFTTGPQWQSRGGPVDHLTNKTGPTHKIKP